MRVQTHIWDIIFPDKYVSKSDIFGPIDYLSDIENLVSFEWAMFEDYGFKYRIIKIFLFLC